MRATEGDSPCPSSLPAKGTRQQRVQGRRMGERGAEPSGLARTHRGDVGVVCHHQAADTVCRRQVRGLPGQCHLDAGRAPGDEVGQFPLPDPLQALVNLGRHEQGLSPGACPGETHSSRGARGLNSPALSSCSARRFVQTNGQDPARQGAQSQCCSWGRVSASASYDWQMTTGGLSQGRRLAARPPPDLQH